MNRGLYKSQKSFYKKLFCQPVTRSLSLIIFLKKKLLVPARYLNRERARSLSTRSSFASLLPEVMLFLKERLF
jgi:hypothetical protein